jgi:GNAT superfamily N-acetyltransferase
VKKNLALPKIELARRTERNFINSFKGAHGIGSAVFSTTDTVTRFTTGYQIAWMNCVLTFNASDKTMNGEIAAIVSDYQKLQCPSYWFVGVLTGRADRVKEALASQGLSHTGNYIGMALDPEEFSPSRSIPQLRIEQVEGARKRRHWLKPFSIAFGAPQIVEKHFDHYGHRHLGDSSREVWFVAYLDDEPVSTAAYMIDSGVIMVHSVTTLPEFRRRGYASMVMETAMAHALKRSRLPFALFSSPMGAEVYKKMGFVETYKLSHFLFEPKI